MVKKAAEFARKVHEGKLRKGSMVPYIVHPFEAAVIVSGMTDDPEVTAVHTRVTQILRGIDPRLSIHDFRMVSGPHHANVIFDMVIPAEYEDKTAQLRREVEAQLQDGKKVYHLVITFDTAAFNELSTEAGEQQSR